MKFDPKRIMDTAMDQVPKQSTDRSYGRGQKRMNDSAALLKFTRNIA